MIRLLYPDIAIATLRQQGIKLKKIQALRWTDQHPQSHYGLGVLLYPKSADIFGGQTFIASRDKWGAILIYNDIKSDKIYGALGLPPNTTGIMQGWTTTQYAETHDISPQYVHEMCATAKINFIKIDKTIIILQE